MAGLCASVALGAAHVPARRHAHHHTPEAAAPAAFATDPAAEPAPEATNGAVSAAKADAMPSTAEQVRTLKQEIAKARPAVEDARAHSALLAREAADLRRRLDATTAHVQALEQDKGRIDAELMRLVPEERAMTAAFLKDRDKVGRLFAVLERLQSGMPPVIAMRADDALSAARSEIVLGASLPQIYAAAADVAKRLAALKTERAMLYARLKESARLAVQLGAAQNQLDQLLAIKSQEADEAGAQYGDLEARLEAAAERAASLEALLAKVAVLRVRAVGQGIVVVAAANTADSDALRRGSLLKPVAGPQVAGGLEGVGGERAPGLTYAAPPSADVVAPADSEVLFAGAYHKTGKVLILEMRGGYDLVLAGLDKIDVKPGDQLLAGEPVGAMAEGASRRLYFELRQNGKGVNPAPWMEVDLKKAKRT